MVRLNGWNPRGERLVSDAPMSHWEMVTFIAGLRQTGIVAPMPIKGAMNGEDPPGLHRAMFGPNTQFPTPSCRAAVKDGRTPAVWFAAMLPGRSLTGASTTAC
jgi:hypothetical protein